MPTTPSNPAMPCIHNTVVFRESVRQNAPDSFEKEGFAENRHFHGTANLGYLEAIKCHFEAIK